jgi:hypothetical protein
MVSQQGPSDVLIMADGRSVTCRKMLEKAAEGCRNLHEAWIIYRPWKRIRRKMAYASANKEILKISMPVGRQFMSAIARDDGYNACGEETTYDTSYSGVESVAWASLPRLTAQGKESILGYTPDVPSERMFDLSGGMPLFWQERKTVKFWMSLLSSYKAKAVLDLTPGSGACARAAMELGLHYSCFCRNAEHACWLRNILDVQALRGMCTSGSSLFVQGYLECVSEHFKDVLDRLDIMDAAEDHEPADMDDEVIDDA